MPTSFARTFAALSATNEAILYAKSPEELYGQVCEAAFSSGDFLATAIFLLEPETNLLRFAAGFGEDTARLRGIDISIAADTPEGSGVCGQAFRDRRSASAMISSTIRVRWPGARARARDRSAPRRRCRSPAMAAASAFPRHPARSGIPERGDRLAARAHVGKHLLCARQFRSRDRAQGRRAGDAPAQPDVRRHQRDQRSHPSRQDRAGTVPAVCDAAVHSGKSFATVVLLAEPGSIWLKPVAEPAKAVTDHPDEILDRSGKPLRQGCCRRGVSNAEGLASTPTSPRKGGPGSRPTRDRRAACVALPLIKLGKASAYCCSLSAGPGQG